MIGMSALFSRIRLAADDPFRDPNVRLLFGAQGISILGSQVSHIAFPLIAVDVISASNGAIALLEAAFLLPFVLFSLPVGALLDRRTRRPVMVAMDLVRTAALLLIPLSYATGALSMPVLYLTLFIIGTATLIFDVADQSYFPELLRGSRLAVANSRLMVMQSGAGGGVGWGAGAAFFLEDLAGMRSERRWALTWTQGRGNEGGRKLVPWRDGGGPGQPWVIALRGGDVSVVRGIL
jgi:MFS family permease